MYVYIIDHTQTRSFLLKLRRLASPPELGNKFATGLRKKPDGREGTCDYQISWLFDNYFQLRG